MSRKPARVKPEPEKVHDVNTRFFTSPETEDSLSIDCANVINAIAVSKAYPELNALAEGGKVIWKDFDELLKKSKTLDASSRITDQKKAARFKLVYLMHRLVWGVLFNGNNDLSKITGDTNLQSGPQRTAPVAITVAPSKVKYAQAIPNGSDGTYSLPIIFGRYGAPKNAKGSSYRLMKEGSTVWSEPDNFKDNRNRAIHGFKLGDKGRLQVRYNGGTTGNGPWSDDIIYVVAGQVI